MHVYAIEAPHGVKVGISQNPTARIRAIETQGGFESSRVWMSTERQDASHIERKTHRLLDHARTVGEWFATQFDDAITAIHSAMDAPANIRQSQRFEDFAAQSGGLRAVSKQIGVSYEAAQKWANGERRPRPDQALLIEQMSNGSVRKERWYWDDNE